MSDEYGFDDGDPPLEVDRNDPCTCCPGIGCLTHDPSCELVRKAKRAAKARARRAAKRKARGAGGKP
jgi:hypothetical protein